MDMECLEYKKKIWEGTRDGYGVFRTQEINMGGNKRYLILNGYGMEWVVGKTQEIHGMGWTGYKRWMVDIEWK